MSWSIHLSDTPIAEVESQARERYDGARANAPAGADPDLLKAMDEQFEATLAAAKILLPAVCGAAATSVNVILGGHANPGHEPQQGWTKDSITVSVTDANRDSRPAAETAEQS